MSQGNEARKRLIEIYRRTFRSPEGAEVLEDMKRRFGYYSPLFDEKSNRKTCFKLGERNVVLFIEAILNQDKIK